MSAAHQALNAAEQALFNNQDPEQVQTLIEAISTAQADITDKEIALQRLYEFEHLLYQEFEKADKLLIDRQKAIVDAEVEKAAEELAEL